MGRPAGLLLERRTAPTETEESPRETEARRASVRASNSARREQETEEESEVRRASVRASNSARRDRETEEEADARGALFERPNAQGEIGRLTRRLILAKLPLERPTAPAEID